MDSVISSERPRRTPPSAFAALFTFGLLLVCAPTRAQEATTTEIDPAVAAAARERFLSGVALARAGDCAAAIAEFDASFRALPRPNTLFNLAQCEEQLHRYDLAVEQYERYLAIAPPEAEDRVTVEATLQSLRNLLGTIHITVNAPSAEVWLGDRIVGVAPGDVLVPGGRHAIELRAPGFLPGRHEVEVTARETVSVDLTLERAEQIVEQHEHIEQHIEETHVHVERQPLPQPVFWTALVLTAGAGVTGLAAGVNALVTHDHVAALDPRLPRDTQGIRDSALVADIGFIAGGVLLIATIVVGVLTDWSDGAPEAEAGATVRMTGDGFAVDF
jgi:hypothetical protein